MRRLGHLPRIELGEQGVPRRRTSPRDADFERATGYAVLREYATEGQHSVWLLKHGVRRNDYAVQYGEQRRERLDYVRACAELGECIMHQLGSSGELD